ncbi:hypothetical protein [Lactobacillus delbrueckii]|uniref:hypothetical protein n=1 Tax=Lactobacillus delbrueckii TaxID=1584 RepID=UPI0022EBC33C|nr:hypothetical protein [Lactobacillus delbrueckii]MDA3784971.1 hypothetical protein [Lactobacillus delbrueckii]MDA3797234.1 hypothetical protein [Lactobacillus delbrueckii]
MEKKKLKKWQIGMLIFLGMAAIGAVEDAVSPEQDSSPKTVKKAHKQRSKKPSSSSSSSSVSSSSSSSSSSSELAKESEDNERLVKAVSQYPKDFELAVVKSEVVGRDINIYLSNSYLEEKDDKERLCRNYWQLAVDDFNKYKKYTEQSTAFVHIYDQSGNELAKSNWGKFEYLGE